MTAIPDDLRWPTHAPVYGAIRLRQFEDRDVPMIQDLATDPYLPTIGTLPASATADEARAYLDRQGVDPCMYSLLRPGQKGSGVEPETDSSPDSGGWDHVRHE